MVMDNPDLPIPSHINLSRRGSVGLTPEEELAQKQEVSDEPIPKTSGITNKKTSSELRELANSIWLTEQCNRYAKGQCLTRRCLIRGGYSGTGPVEDPDCATCEAMEIAAALREAANEIERRDPGVMMNNRL